MQSVPAGEVASGVLDAQRVGEHEQVVHCYDPETGLRAIVAIHSTRLGPSLGGTRFHPYADESAALTDVLRLSQAMTFKSAAAGLDLGGGKAVVIGDPATGKSEALLRAYGRFVERLGGHYITTEDVGTTVPDMAIVAEETRWVTGTPLDAGGSGDPSPATAVGVFEAMRAAARHTFGSDDLAGRHVAVSGVGKVGSALVEHLLGAGAKVTAADVDTAALAAFGDRIEVVPPEKIHAVACDIFSPCALGGALDPVTIPELSCAAVVGSANNQLASDECGRLLHQAGVLYVPDFVANAGGVVNIAFEIGRRYRWDDAVEAVRRIGATTTAVIETAEREGIPTSEAANRVAQRRLAAGTRTGIPPDPRPGAASTT